MRQQHGIRRSTVLWRNYTMGLQRRSRFRTRELPHGIRFRTIGLVRKQIPHYGGGYGAESDSAL